MSINGTQILVVDDSPTVRRLAELILSPQGYVVHTAEDGEQGLKMAQDLRPEAILVDFVMPKINGYRFCKILRSDPSFKDVPLILITSKGEDVGQRFEKDFGVLDYFTKPFEPEELVAKLDEVLNARAPDSEGQPMRSSVPAASSSPEGDPVQSVELLREFQDRFDKMLRQYFQKDFPVLMKNVLSDTLKETGLVKKDTLILSGDLGHLPLPDLLNFIYNSRLSGRLTIFSKQNFGEIFLEKGMFVFATASKKGPGNQFLTDLISQEGRLSSQQLMQAVEEARVQNIPIGRKLVQRGLITEEELMAYLRRHAQGAFNRILEVSQGNFFLEDDRLPLNIQDITYRIPLIHILMDGLRQLDEKELAASEFKDESIVLIRLVSNENVLDSVELNEHELRLFGIIDGKKSLAEIIEESPFDAGDTKRICYVLRKAGLLRPKNN